MFSFLDSICPNLKYDNVLDIPWDLLKDRGIRHLVFDLDNTLLPWGNDKLPNHHLELLKNLHDSGFWLSILTNSKLKGRQQQLQRQIAPFGVMLLRNGNKPLAGSFLKVLKPHQTPPEKAAMIGDQSLTDIVGGNRLNMTTILVNPIAPEQEPGWARRRRKVENFLLIIKKC